jgi:hypothetical protein
VVAEAAADVAAFSSLLQPTITRPAATIDTIANANFFMITPVQFKTP